MAKPKLALIPSTVGGSVYSVLPSNGDGDFNFSRASAATRINAQGLIETVAATDNRLNYPLLDGTVQTCPHLLLEGQRTNNVLYSEETSNAYWFKSNCTITPNTSISPDGTLNADTLTLTSTNGVVYRTGITCGSLSFFAKDINLTIGKFRISVDGVGIAKWNKDGSLSSVAGGTASSGVNYGNGWFRFAFNVTSGTVVNYGIEGITGESILVYGLQNELSATYASSYIPTTSSTTTRLAEVCNGSGNASTFNDSEGVLFAQIGALAEDNSYKSIELSDGTTANRMNIWYWIDGTLRVDLHSSSIDQFGVFIDCDLTIFNKLLVKYKLNDFSVWLNGFEVYTDTSGVTPIGLSDLSFSQGGIYPFYGKTKQIQYFDSALTDSELETLTSWMSFSDMAIDLNYTIQ
jgi:hypothetical protein